MLRASYEVQPESSLQIVFRNIEVILRKKLPRVPAYALRDSRHTAGPSERFIDLKGSTIVLEQGFCPPGFDISGAESVGQ